jgi:exo-beta-1,3-glucanase (GH17 family)
MAADLDLIRSAGFSGIVTSTSNDKMERVPKLAQKRGLRVIMGIWNPGDAWEVSRAIRQRDHVDAYCIGHGGYRDRYSLDQLESALNHVKRRTGKPAAISELARHYDANLARLGDWHFPDAHLTINDGDGRFSADVDRDLEVFMSATQRVIPFAQETGKPVLFANVAYPYAGIPNANRHRQREFFRRLLDRINDPQRGHAVKVAIVAQTAFDTKWKTEKPFYEWDLYTGLIDPNPSSTSRQHDTADEWDGVLSPAGRAIRHWYPHLEEARKGSSPADGRSK